jgi:hypothetical protein
MAYLTGLLSLSYLVTYFYSGTDTNLSSPVYRTKKPTVPAASQGGSGWQGRKRAVRIKGHLGQPRIQGAPAFPNVRTRISPSLLHTCTANKKCGAMDLCDCGLRNAIPSSFTLSPTVLNLQCVQHVGKQLELFFVCLFVFGFLRQGFSV